MGKAKTEKRGWQKPPPRQQTQHAQLYYIQTGYIFRKREPLIALGSHQGGGRGEVEGGGGSLISASAVPHPGEQTGQCMEGILS